jgi:allophanate hydrolase subunit 2
MDKRNYLLANKLVGNNFDAPIIEFAYQGPLLKYFGKKIIFAEYFRFFPLYIIIFFKYI